MDVNLPEMGSFDNPATWFEFRFLSFEIRSSGLYRKLFTFKNLIADPTGGSVQ